MHKKNNRFYSAMLLLPLMCAQNVVHGESNSGEPVTQGGGGQGKNIPAGQSSPQNALTDTSVEDQAGQAIEDSKKAISDVHSVELPENLGQRQPGTGLKGLSEVQLTIKNLLQTLVEQGVLSDEQARNIEEQAMSNAKAKALSGAPEENLEPRIVRVPHVPDSVIEDIRKQVEADLRPAVVEDVMAQAKNERWGLPGALPEWISKIKWGGDVRLRGESDIFDGKNVGGLEAFDGYIDFQELNESGGFGRTSDPFFNTTENRTRLRTRARLAATAKPTEGVKLGFRLSTGSTGDPVSTNQTLGNSAKKYQVVWDQAYLQYKDFNEDGRDWFTFTGGLIPNPWLHTDLVWDSDLSFEGVAATFRFNLRGSGNLLDITADDRTLFFTVGAFPIDEIELASKDDKWLLGAQVGMEWVLESQSNVKFGLAYYDYQNITGKKNEPFSTLNDHTAPEYMQKGNSLFDIRNDDDPTTDRWALASDYNLLNFTAAVDFAHLAPLHITLTGDWVKNIGYDKDQVKKRTGADDSGVRTVFRSGDSGQPDEGEDIYKAKTTGWQVQLEFGWPKVSLRNTWQVFMAYKYLERDAVLDAFTDSDFHLGGTDAKGWVLGGHYALVDDMWLTARWMSTDEIDHDPFGVDVLQIDINAKF